MIGRMTQSRRRLSADQSPPGLLQTCAAGCNPHESGRIPTAQNQRVQYRAFLLSASKAGRLTRPFPLQSAEFNAFNLECPPHS